MPRFGAHESHHAALAVIVRVHLDPGQRAAERVGERVQVLIEEPDGTGRASHQGPEVDGSTRVVASSVAVGSLVDAVVVEADGIDLIATEAP